MREAEMRCFESLFMALPSKKTKTCWLSTAFSRSSAVGAGFMICRACPRSSRGSMHIKKGLAEGSEART